MCKAQIHIKKACMANWTVFLTVSHILGLQCCQSDKHAANEEGLANTSPWTPHQGEMCRNVTQQSFWCYVTLLQCYQRTSEWRIRPWWWRWQTHLAVNDSGDGGRMKENKTCDTLCLRVAVYLPASMSVCRWQECELPAWIKIHRRCEGAVCVCVCVHVIQVIHIKKSCVGCR